MIFKDIMKSDYGKTKALILMLMCLGIFRNIIKYRYSFLMITFFIITLFIKKICYEFSEYFSLSFMMMYILKYVINYNGHDYNKYVDWYNVPIELLFIISWLSVFLIYYGFRKKYKGDRSILPFLIIGNTSIQYMSMGVLRNLIAFSLWNISEYFIVIIPFIHISSMVYFMSYYFIRNDKNKIKITIIGIIFICFILSLFIPSNFFRVTKYILKWNYFLDNAFYYGNWKYYIIVSSSIIPVYLINKKKLDTWMLIYCFMFIYIYHFKFMIRMVYISFFALSQLLMKLDNNKFIKKYLILLSIYYLTSVVP